VATFTAQVQYKTGDTTAYTAQYPIWLDDGVRDVVDRVVAINPSYEKHFVTTDTITSSTGLAIETARVLRVSRVNNDTGLGVFAPLVPVGMGTEAGDSGSIHYATVTHPVSYIQSGKVFCKPAPDATAVVYLISYGTVDDSAGTITNFPSSLHELVVLYAAMRATEYRIATLRGEMRSYIDTDEDLELAQLKGAEIAKAEALIVRLASEYAAGFERVKR
jgi:hypothetical protein